MRNGKLFVAAAFGALVGAALFGTLRPASAARDGRAMCGRLRVALGPIGSESGFANSIMQSSGPGETSWRRRHAEAAAKQVRDLARGEAAKLLLDELCADVTGGPPRAAF